MRTHLYNSTLGKLGWFVERFGTCELFLKPIRRVLSPFVIPLLPQRDFQFHGISYQCFYHRYNVTWANERMVEIPIAKSYLDRHAGNEILEIGNVLSHYYPVAHDIVDKYEMAPRVRNVDILHFQPQRHYDLIFSISTIEHVGFDDETSKASGQTVEAAIVACRRLLKPEGQFIMTVPIGYNPELDRLIAGSRLGAQDESYLRRVKNRCWEATTKDEALDCQYGSPFPYGNAVLVAEFRHSPASVLAPHDSAGGTAD